MTTRRDCIKHGAAAVVILRSALQRAEALTMSDKTKEAPADRPLRLAIVGTGQISHRYLKQSAQGQRGRFIATCARTVESARARAVEYGIDRWFDNYEAMYDQAKPDAVVIATPSAVHAEPAIAALNRGIHVLCEKPMATSFMDCRAMVEAAEKSGAVFLALPFNATPSFMTALQYLNEPTLGVFTGAEAQLNLPGHDRANWYYNKDVAGGVMLDTLVYPVSKLIGFLGPAKRVTGFVNTLIPHRLVGAQMVESDIDDNVSLIVEWASGQQALLRALWGTSMFRGDTVIYGRQGTLFTGVFGTDVVIHSPKRVIERGMPITWHGQNDCYQIHSQPQVASIAGEGLIDHFSDCIQGRAQPTCGGVQQLHVHEILFKGYEAARTGRTQELETTFVPWHPIDPKFLDTRSRAI